MILIARPKPILTQRPFRLLRGGALSYQPSNAYSCYRNYNVSRALSDYYGFRLVLRKTNNKGPGPEDPSPLSPFNPSQSSTPTSP